MTSEEARQKVNSCERNIKESYSELLECSKEVGGIGYDSVKSDKQAEVDLSHDNIVLLLFIALIPVIGVVLCYNSHPVWGVLLIVLGLFLIICVWGASIDEQQKKSEAIKSKLNGVINSESELNSILDSNRSI